MGGRSRAAGSFSIDLALTELIADEFDKKWDPKGTKGGIRERSASFQHASLSLSRERDTCCGREKLRDALERVLEGSLFLSFSLSLSLKEE